MGITDIFKPKRVYIEGSGDRDKFFKDLDDYRNSDDVSKALNGRDVALVAPPDGNFAFGVVENQGIVPKPSRVAPGKINEFLKQHDRNVLLNAIINTRANQVLQFSERAATNKDGQGFRIRLKSGAKPTDKQKEKIAYAERYFEHMGVDYSSNRSTFALFLKQFVHDTYTYDQVNYEHTWDSRGFLNHTRIIDPTTIYFARDSNGQRKLTGKIYRQYINGQIIGSFSDKEMGMFIRNPRTDIQSGGYGISEFEIGMRDFLSHDNTELYNSRFFTHGGTAKGLLLITPPDNATVPARRALEDLKRQWTITNTGINGAYRTPIVTAKDAKYISMTNAEDMQFQSWLNYLVNILCALYTMDASEIGMSNRGGATGSKSNSLNESNNQSKIDASKSKGLFPLLTLIAQNLTDNIVRHILGDKYMLEFVGGDARSEKEKVDADKAHLATDTTVNELRIAQGKDKIEAGDYLLDGTYIQAMGNLEQIKQNKIANQQTRITQLEEALTLQKGKPNPLPSGTQVAGSPQIAGNTAQDAQKGYDGKPANPSGKDNQVGVGKDGQLKNKKNTNSMKQGSDTAK